MVILVKEYKLYIYKQAVLFSHRLSRNNQRDWQQQTQLTSTDRYMLLIPVWEQLATDQTDPWHVVPRQVFTPYDCLLISVACDVLCRVGCH